MSTETLVDELVQRQNGWNRSGDHGVLRYLNTAHAILMAQESQQNLIFDEATGTLPTLATTDGTYKYVMAANVWRVSGVLIDNDIDISPQAGRLVDVPVHVGRRELNRPYSRSINCW